MTPALLVVVVGALASAAPPGDASAELTVEVSRPHLVLGEDDGADVTVSVGGVGEVGDVRLFTNVGRTLELRRVGERRFLARYEAPKQFYPHVAVLVAVADVAGEPRSGFTTLPLWGQGALEASGAPGSDVVAVIGGRTYGPSTADDEGVARIAIRVAPGESEARAGDETLPLGSPDFPRVVGVALTRPLVAHPALEVSGELRFFVTAPDGQPLAAPELRLDVPGRGTGRVDAPVVLAPGVVAARVHVPGGAAPGTLEVRWRLTGSAASKGSVPVDVAPASALEPSLAGYGEAGDGAVTDLALEVPDTLVLGRDGPVPLAVTLPEGARASAVRVFTNVGHVSPLVARAGGRYEATFHPPAERHAQVALLAAVADVDGTPHLGLGRVFLHGQERVRVSTRRHARVTVEVAGERFGPVKANRRGIANVPVVVPPGVDVATFDGKPLPLERPPFPRLLVVPLASHLVADGQREVPVRVYALGDTGAPLVDAAVRLDVDQGALSPLEPAGKGVSLARYRAPSTPGVARFVAALEGDASPPTTARLPLLSPASAALLASSSGGGTGGAGPADDVVSASVPPPPREDALVLLGAHAGFASNFIALYAPLAAVDVTLQGSGALAGPLVQLELGSLYQPGESRVSTGALAGATYPRHLLAVPLVATLGWRARFGDASVIGSVGAKADYVYSVVGDASEQFLSIGAVGQLAGAYRLGPGEVVLKARYTYGGLEGGFGAATLLCGYAFEVF